MPLNQPLDPVTEAIYDYLKSVGWQTETQVVVALESANPAAVRAALKNGLTSGLFTTWIVGSESRCGLMHWPSEPKDRKNYVP